MKRKDPRVREIRLINKYVPEELRIDVIEFVATFNVHDSESAIDFEDGLIGIVGDSGERLAHMILYWEYCR